jgi:hypothetical protein
VLNNIILSFYDKKKKDPEIVVRKEVADAKSQRIVQNEADHENRVVRIVRGKPNDDNLLLIMATNGGNFSSRDYSRRSRSRDYRRSRSRDRNSRRKSISPPKLQQKIDITPAQQAQITQFLSASLSGLAPSQQSILSAPSILHPPIEPIRTDFSNLFQSTSTFPVTAGLNSSALAIAAAKAKDLLRAKNLTETVSKIMPSNGNSVTSNGNESSHDGIL